MLLGNVRLLRLWCSVSGRNGPGHTHTGELSQFLTLGAWAVMGTSQHLVAWASVNIWWCGHQSTLGSVGISQHLVVWASVHIWWCGHQSTLGGVGISQHLVVWASVNT